MTQVAEKPIRYKYNGLYCPKAVDFLPETALLVDVPGFLESCCVRLERLFPDVPHVASLVKEMRVFSSHETVAEFPELESECEYAGECVVAMGTPTFDDTLPE